MIHKPETIYVAGSKKVKFPNEGFSKGTAFIELLTKNGFEVLKNFPAKYFFSFDYNHKEYEAFISNGGSKENAFLIRMEPEVVFPRQYKSLVESKFKSIATLGTIDDTSGFFCGWPYKPYANPNEYTPIDAKQYLNLANKNFNFENWVIRPIDLSLIAANKVSPIRSQNYDLRRKIVSELKSNSNFEFQVYGELWTESIKTKIRHRLAVTYFNLKNYTLPSPISIYGSLFRNYHECKGIVENKHNVLTLSKFSLIIENSDTYVSEKLFDCIFNGAIPIYFGTKFDNLLIPEDIVIRFTGNIEDLPIFLMSLKRSAIEEVANSAIRFLNSDNFKKYWTEEKVFTKIIADFLEKN